MVKLTQSSNAYRLRWGVVLVLLLALAAPGAPGAWAEPEAPAEPLVLTPRMRLPLVMAPTSCSTGETYGTMNVPPPVTDRPAHLHGDLNLALRGYSGTGGVKGLVSINGDTDDRAPQLDSLFATDRLPVFKNNYQVYDWIWPANGGTPPHGHRGSVVTNPPVTLAGFQVTPNETIHVPDSGYQIGALPTYNALVLYAEANRLTLKYTAEDNVVQGYTLHLERLCVDAALLALYQAMNAAGRDHLPALRHGQALGRAMTDEVIVAIRDNGTSMDPRSCKDWWKDYPCP